MKNPFLPVKPRNHNDNTDPALVHLHIQDYDRSEIGEFLDESLRMKDQPFTHTEESVAAGSPDDLL